MAKTTKKSRVVRTDRKKWLLMVVVGVALLIISVVVMCLMHFAAQRDQRADERFEADKARFAQVEADMDEAYAAIVAAVGVPVREESGKSCYHKSAKFEEGTLKCEIDRYADYGSKPDEGKILSNLREAYHITQDGLPYLARNVNEPSGTSIREHRFTTNGFSCYMELTSAKSGMTKVSFGCSDAVERPIYPLAE